MCHIYFDFHPIALTNSIHSIKLRSPSLSELTLMIFNMGLTHLDSEASISSY